MKGAAEHVWMLADNRGGNLAEVTAAAGKQLAFTRNAFIEAQCALSHETPAAGLFWGSLRDQGIPQLKVYRDHELVFRGHLAPFQETVEDTAMMSLVFRSPFARLVGNGPAAGRFMIPGPGFEAPGFGQVDAGEIARTLLLSERLLGRPVGLTEVGGVHELTKRRDRLYAIGANVGEAIVALTQLLDGFDFRERFVEDEDNLAIFDVFASLGEARPDARFEYGPQTLANVRAASRTVTPPINYVTIMGANGLLGGAQDTASIAKYGAWAVHQTQSDVVELQTLNDKARELLRPNPVRIIRFAADPAISPRPLDDFDLGDTVSFLARRAAFQEDVAVRVNAFTIVVDDNGREAYDIPDPLTPESEASIRSAITTEVAA